jgi:hypothetical protein
LCFWQGALLCLDLAYAYECCEDVMNFQPADQLSLSLFVAFAVVMFVIMLMALRKTSDWKKWTGLFLGLLLAFTAAGLLGIVVQHFIPFGPILFVSLFIFAIAFCFSKSGNELANLLPLTILVGFQAFRLPLELILHRWVSVGTIPETMTWTGQNIDVLTGILSLLAIPFLNKNKYVPVVVNAIGFILLLNVVRVVLMSSPLPFAWPLERPILLVAYFPYNLIGPLFVMPALIGHLLVFKKLKQKQ